MERGQAVASLIAEDWREVAFRAGSTDRERAEAGVRLAYRTAGLAEPERIVWAASPARGAVLAAVATGGARALGPFGELPEIAEVARGGPGASVRHQVRTVPWERARAEAYARLGAPGWARAWAEHAAPLWDPVNRLVTMLRREVRGLAGDDATAEALLRGAMLDAVLGQHDAPWLAVFDRVLPGEALRGLGEVACSAGWWWPYERVAIVSERPLASYRDELERPHRAEGPAVAYGDGFALHAWHGMPVPPGFAQELAALTPARIDNEENAELRRVMLEHYGYERYLRESGAKPVMRDETGMLWRILMNDDEPVAMVEVVNSTPEPDGTFRTYFLRVPPFTRSPREGVAWTFGLSAEEYQPEKET
ncbi:hypothetical protein HNP84_001694 [Thermocatellispora tengchongensis]|uniref:DUF6745 domain-containing protein n=1 Tax=Thermocatellispora tengchongensis TaxID=1073253 RepID=A0A840P263_9ACTN|nr:hypothetical protein [Thermocatellispora tengchongensis]MBB5131981.1 hypothetical protein [Thermocatellispora tengchongensis]